MMLFKLVFSSFTVLMLIIPITGNAQENEIKNNEKKSPRGLYAYGGIGPAIPLGNFGNERQLGLDLNTAFEYRYEKGLLIRGMFDFSNFPFNKGTISQVSNGTSYAIGGSNSLISLIGAIGYSLQLSRFAPYSFIGAGASNISKPTIDVDKVSNTVELSTRSNTYFSTAAGVGTDFILKETRTNVVIMYIEGFYTYLPSQTEVSAYKVNLLSFNIGLKSKF